MFQAAPRADPSIPVDVSENRSALPGFGRPLDFFPVAEDAYGIKSCSLFPSALDDRDIERGYINQPITTIREITMLRIMDEFTDLPDWTDKVLDNAYMDKWKHEVSARADVSPKMVEWVTEELRFKARIMRYTDAINIYNGDVVKSDPKDLDPLVEEFREAVVSLEKSDEHILELSLYSDKREYDVVHPSLFPLVYGRSRILKNRVIGIDDAIASIGEGEILKVPEDPGILRKDMSWNISSRADINVSPFSSSIQWLPSDVRFRPDGSCYFTSYINNIHPDKYRDAYRLIERALDKMISMWNLTLTPLKDTLHSRSRIEYLRASYGALAQAQKPEQSSNETEAEYEDRLHKWRKAIHSTIQPDPGVFAPIAIPPRLLNEVPEEERNKHRIESQMDLRRDYGDRGLQVLVRIFNIKLSPEMPDFETSWHVAGQLNEHICASAQYYFDNDNVIDPRMNFRQISDVSALLDVVYEQGDSVWLEDVFGLTNYSPAVQEVGSMTCRQGRVITWPNSLQHQVTGLRLKDPSKPGHCRVLDLMLVDPNIRIISTANVPPQRIDWKDGLDLLHRDLKDLSVEDQEKLRNRQENFPFTLSEAKEFLVKAREERKAFNHYQDVAFHSKLVAV